MMNYLWIGVGSGIGGMLRYWMSGVLDRRFGETFPVGTLVVNVSGSCVIGFFAAMVSPDGRWLVHPAFRQFVMIGVLGGFTTFSAFSFQTLNLARDGEWLWAGVNVVASVAVCLVAVWAGHAAAMNLNR